MYTPRAFAFADTAQLHAFIAQSRLATLVTHTAAGLQASHLPLLLDLSQGPHGTLSGHLARANPQWQALAAGAEAMVIFQGPEAYISPGFYPAKAEHGKVVPTWNYVAVHAYGRPEVFDDAQRLHTLVSQLTDRFEGPRPQPWAVEDAPADYIAGMLKAIVGFSLPIERLEGKRKLSQNRSNADIAGVKAALTDSNEATERALAHLIDIDSRKP